MTVVREIEAKVLLAHVKQRDKWFGLRYSMNLYRGCQHRCIYCDSRSECYGIEDFDGEVLVKANAIPLLRRELARKRVNGTIGLGSMNDPYMPVERQVGLTGQALAAIAEFGYPVHVMTKSAFVLRDVDLLAAIGRVYATVTFTITTVDDGLARKIEPDASPPSERLAAMAELSGRGIRTGVTLMPVLPFLEDTAESVLAVVEAASRHGASYVIPDMGVTLRDRQRAYFYARLDEVFPGVRQRNERAFAERYSCAARSAHQLDRLVREACAERGLAARIIAHRQATAEQPRLL